MAYSAGKKKKANKGKKKPTKPMGY